MNKKQKPQNRNQHSNDGWMVKNADLKMETGTILWCKQMIICSWKKNYIRKPVHVVKKEMSKIDELNLVKNRWESDADVGFGKYTRNWM